MKNPKQREMLAAALALVVGLPLVFVFARAVADGTHRYAETPFRAIFGDERYEEMLHGEEGPLHYLKLPGTPGEILSAPDFELKAREGGTWKLSDHRGKVVVMNFWSVTCRPCIEEMPKLETLAELSDRWDDVEVVAISADDTFADVDPVLPEQTELKHLIDPGRTIIAGAYGTNLFPETWIVDRQGVVRMRYDGPRDWSDPLVLDVIESFR